MTAALAEYSTPNNDVGPPAPTELLMLAIDDVRPSAYNPRKHFDADALDALVRSIRQSGVLQPIQVRELRDLGFYEIIAGERRWRAAKKAGLELIPALVTDITDAEAAVDALVENLQRENLNPLEEAEGFARVLSLGSTQTDLAARLNRSQPYIANSCRMLQLPESVKHHVSLGRLSRSHAVALCALSFDLTRLAAIAEETVTAAWSVRDLEELIREITGRVKAPAPAVPIADPADIADAPDPSPSTGAIAQESALACPACGCASSDHSGILTRESPDAPPLDPPVEMRKCRGCYTPFRADGKPFNAVEHSARFAPPEDESSAGPSAGTSAWAPSAVPPAAASELPVAVQPSGPLAAIQQATAAAVQRQSQPTAPGVPPESGGGARTIADPAPTTAAAPQAPAPSMVNCAIPTVLDDWLYDHELTVVTALELLRRIQDTILAANCTPDLEALMTAIDSGAVKF